MRHVITVTVMLVLAACADERLTVDVVLAPGAVGELTINSLRLQKTVDGTAADPWRRDGVTVSPDGSVARVQIRHAKGAQHLTLLGYGAYDSTIVAEGALVDLDLTKAPPVARLELNRCAMSALATGSMCEQKPVVDAGSDAGESRDAAPVCVHDTDDVATVVPEIPLTTAECDQYCADLARVCAEIPDTSLGDPNRCRVICERVHGPVVTITFQDDSLGCRKGNLSSAEMNPALKRQFCGSASYLHPGACGSPCRTYCRIGLDVCPGTFVGTINECEVACLAAARDKPVAELDFVNCRFGKLAQAALDPSFCPDAWFRYHCPTCP